MTRYTGLASEKPPPSRGWPWVAAVALVAANQLGTTMITGSVEQGLLVTALFVPLLR